MIIDYKTIVFKNSNLKWIINLAFFFLFFYFMFYVFLTGIGNNFIKKIDSKYSYEVFYEYYKGGVINPYSFYKTSLIYKRLGKVDKEMDELFYARELLAQKKSNTELDELINKRLSEINALSK